MKTPRTKAFTLVELLVVIAIIALLISILAPTMRAAKDLARLVCCKTNVNALAKSVLVYAEANKGYMMVNRHVFLTYDGKDYIEAPHEPKRCAVAFTGPYNALTGMLMDARNFGLVYASRFFEHPEMFYCPGLSGDPRQRITHYPRPWGSAAGLGSAFIHVSYPWNPWVTWPPFSGEYGDVDVTYEDELLLARHPQDRFLTGDQIFEMSTIGHFTGKGAVWNLAYPDGHVEGFESPIIYSFFSVGIKAGDQWGIYQQYVHPYLPGN